MNRICIINLKNCQEEYAVALEFIKEIEDKKGNIAADKKSILMQAARKILIDVGDVQKNIAPRYLEQPISVSGRGNISAEIIQNKHPFSEMDTVNLGKRDQNIIYHIRIHFDEDSNSAAIGGSELLELQYLAMFLKKSSQYLLGDQNINQFQNDNKKTDEKRLKNRLTVFIVPVTGKKYPFRNQNGEIDYLTYIYASRYLRLLSKRYTGVIYGVNESAGQPIVTSLDFRKNAKCKTYFPLTIIDEKVYDSLFVTPINGILDELFLLKSNGRFRKSRDENPVEALEDFIAETNLYRLRDVASVKCCSEILFFLKSREDISLMEFSLFAFMLSEKIIVQKTNNLNGKYLELWSLVHEISQGLKQVVQNAIQHTENRACFFSFYLHEKETAEDSGNFKDRIEKLYPNTYFNMSEEDEALEILISDLNDKEDMIDNFISNLNYEWYEQERRKQNRSLLGHLKLIQSREKLAIRNFFSVYNKEDARDEWKCFRQEDLIAHIGLSQFSQTAEKCKASVKVISSKYSELSDEKRFFYRAYNGEYKRNISSTNSEWRKFYVIPGTQFSVLIPVRLWDDNYSMGIGQLEQQNCVEENYASFASFLEYHEKRKEIILTGSDTHNSQRDILDAKRKYKLVQQWREYWEEKFRESIEILNDEEKYVFNYDFSVASAISYLKNEDRIEVFLKGMISALDVADDLNELFLIAITNLPKGVIDVFQKISVQLSVKDFPGNVQLCLHEKAEEERKNKRIIMLGKDFLQAICNAYVLCMEQGVEGFKKGDCEKALEIKRTLLSELNLHDEQYDLKKEGVCPFDVILHCSEKDERVLFEKQLEEMAEGSLDEELIGYKLNDTHMRLGSKVHIESFYEMSFLFYRTTVANRLAFIILRRINDSVSKTAEEKRVDILADSILFYGYASYSKAVLTSINEILRIYRKNKSDDENFRLEDKVAIAAFQHNLMLESEETQMYYDIPKDNFPAKVNEQNYLCLQDKIKVVQIVPISSTLTTFDKMWKKISDAVLVDERDKLSLAGNYTVFWVVDKNGNLDKGKPSKVEEKYWEEVLEKRTIMTKLPTLANAGNLHIQYFIRSAVVWHDPLKCELCYPRHVIDEVPLVETDSTSTVPTQQIRHKGYRFVKTVNREGEDYERFVKLENCVLYNHIGRRQNHYQFYIDTQQYFYNVKGMVKEWLEEKNRTQSFKATEPVMHIIFSPEHNTNVGFVQYVNTYYFDGMAEIVSLNVDKQFRSNFICEHAALKRMIEELHRNRRDIRYLPVKFYFVDDTIITGDTLEKANGLLHSLVPVNEYPVNLFSKIFVLVDRLSEETKQTFVNIPEQNFISFLHIDVSNVRTHGDSCIGCKLEQDAKVLYKRSATRNMAFYWNRKLNDYRKKAYDDKDKIALIDKDKSYRMLLFSHVLQNIIVKQGNCYGLGDAYDVVLNLCLWLLGADEYMGNDIYGYNQFLGNVRNLNGVYILLKTVCRPFFTYDFKIKRQIYTFFIFLTELILGEECEDIVPDNIETKGNISYLSDRDRILKTKILAEKIKEKLVDEKQSELKFLKDYMLEGLTDMGSTYVMRMQTLKKVYTYVEDSERKFKKSEKKSLWDSYEVNIHRLVTGNADESRELWLEYMYITGREYFDFCEEYSEKGDVPIIPQFFYRSIVGENTVNLDKKYFHQFCHNLFLQNTGINFDELEEKNKRQHTNKDMVDFQKIYWRQMRRLDSFKNPLFVAESQEEFNMKNERRLFELLENKPIEEQSVNEWYKKFLNYIVEVIGEKYNIEKKDINIAMLTENQGKEGVKRIQLLDIVKENINYKKLGISETRYCIKERVVNALNEESIFDLENNGYTALEGNDLAGSPRPYVIAFFDNPKKSKDAIFQRRLARIFLYISVSKDEEKNNTQLTLHLILRDVLTYRNRILRFLEKDFAGEIYASYAHTIGEKNILSHEKAHSHNTTADDEISLEIFQGNQKFGKGSDYAVLDRQKAAEWLLLRNYTNGQIAKIFNRSFHDSKGKEDEEVSLNSPMLYIPKDSINRSNNVFKHKMDFFFKLNLKNENTDLQDGRFILLNEIIDIQYDESLNNARFIRGNKGQYYNLEYFKSILIDIMISAIKFESDRSDYLTRIDRFLEIKTKLKNNVQEWNMENEEIAGLVKSMKESCCYIKIYREESPYQGIDYLVIKNPVKNVINILSNWKKQNEIIVHRLQDPLDYADGHMSLLAIKRYIENIDEKFEPECVFQYTISESQCNQEVILYFENRLPILRREKNETAILD